MQVQFNRPLTLTAEDGESITCGKGVHPVPAKFCKGWFFDAMKAENAVAVLAEGEEPEGEADLLEGKVKEIVAKIEAAELSADDLVGLVQCETEGKNRKGVLDALAAKQAK